MISAAKISSGRAAGFTLLEIIVVLAIAAMVMGGGLAALYFNRDEAVLRGASEEIEILAKRARTIATLQQQPYALEISPGRVSLMPYAEAMLEPSDREGFLAEREFQREIASVEAPEAVTPRQPVRDGWVAEDDMTLLVRRWSSPDWQQLKRNDRHVWRFDPNGICEPVALRIEMEQSWIMFRFHPLSAAITETEMEIQ